MPQRLSHRPAGEPVRRGALGRTVEAKNDGGVGQAAKGVQETAVAAQRISGEIDVDQRPDIRQRAEVRLRQPVVVEPHLLQARPVGHPGGPTQRSRLETAKRPPVDRQRAAVCVTAEAVGAEVDEFEKGGVRERRRADVLDPIVAQDEPS